MENKIKEFLEAQKEVRLAYIFGSAARREMGNLSDVDIGVYLDNSLSKHERFKIRLELASQLGKLLENDRIDLIVMNDSPLPLNYNIIKHGKILKSDEGLRVRFEAGILSRYLDRKYYMDRHDFLALKRISERGFS